MSHPTSRLFALWCMTVLLLLGPFIQPAATQAQGVTLSMRERGCQQGAIQALGVLSQARAACAARCDKKAPQGPDCAPPFGGKTRARVLSKLVGQRGL